MIDRLEAEVVSLRRRNKQLQSALGKSPSARGTPTRTAKKNRNKGRQTSKSPGKSSTKKVQQLELPAVLETQSEQKEGRVLGKRQALGRSILQLRKATSNPAG